MQITQPPIQLQQASWNEWNTRHPKETLAAVSFEQAKVVLSWLTGLGRANLDLIEVGCGTGWFCSQLTPFGRVTGTDLSNPVLARAEQRVPEAGFVAGDFMAIDFGAEYYDVVVSLEVLSHVADQPAFVDKMASILKPGGYLILATQNRSALERNAVPPPQPGQLRQWVDRCELRRLLGKDFIVEELFSITPQFNRGFLRLLNSNKLTTLAASLGLGGVMAEMKRREERAWLGWTLMALARKAP